MWTPQVFPSGILTWATPFWLLLAVMAADLAHGSSSSHPSGTASVDLQASFSLFSLNAQTVAPTLGTAALFSTRTLLPMDMMSSVLASSAPSPSQPQLYAWMERSILGKLLDLNQMQALAGSSVTSEPPGSSSSSSYSSSSSTNAFSSVHIVGISPSFAAALRHVYQKKVTSILGLSLPPWGLRTRRSVGDDVDVKIVNAEREGGSDVINLDFFLQKPGGDVVAMETALKNLQALSTEEMSRLLDLPVISSPIKVLNGVSSTASFEILMTSIHDGALSTRGLLAKTSPDNSMMATAASSREILISPTSVRTLPLPASVTSVPVPPALGSSGLAVESLSPGSSSLPVQQPFFESKMTALFIGPSSVPRVSLSSQMEQVSLSSRVETVSLSSQMDPVSVSSQMDPVSLLSQTDQVSLSPQLHQASLSSQMDPVSPSSQMNTISLSSQVEYVSVSSHSGQVSVVMSSPGEISRSAAEHQSTPLLDATSVSIMSAALSPTSTESGATDIASSVSPSVGSNALATSNSLLAVSSSLTSGLSHWSFASLSGSQLKQPASSMFQIQSSGVSATQVLDIDSDRVSATPIFGLGSNIVSATSMLDIGSNTVSATSDLLTNNLFHSSVLSSQSLMHSPSVDKRVSSDVPASASSDILRQSLFSPSMSLHASLKWSSLSILSPSLETSSFLVSSGSFLGSPGLSQMGSSPLIPSFSKSQLVQSEFASNVPASSVLSHHLKTLIPSQSGMDSSKTAHPFYSLSSQLEPSPSVPLHGVVSVSSFHPSFPVTPSAVPPSLSTNALGLVWSSRWLNSSIDSSMLTMSPQELSSVRESAQGVSTVQTLQQSSTPRLPGYSVVSSIPALPVSDALVSPSHLVTASSIQAMQWSHLSSGPITTATSSSVGQSTVGTVLNVQSSGPMTASGPWPTASLVSNGVQSALSSLSLTTPELGHASDLHLTSSMSAPSLGNLQSLATFSPSASSSYKIDLTSSLVSRNSIAGFYQSLFSFRGVSTSAGLISDQATSMSVQITPVSHSLSAMMSAMTFSDVIPAHTSSRPASFNGPSSPSSQYFGTPYVMSGSISPSALYPTPSQMNPFTSQSELHSASSSSPIAPLSMLASDMISTGTPPLSSVLGSVGVVSLSNSFVSPTFHASTLQLDSSRQFSSTMSNLDMSSLASVGLLMGLSSALVSGVVFSASPLFTMVTSAYPALTASLSHEPSVESVSFGSVSLATQSAAYSFHSSSLGQSSAVSIQVSSLLLFPTTQSASSPLQSSPLGQPSIAVPASSLLLFPTTQSGASIQASSPLLFLATQSGASIQASSIELFPTTQSGASIQASSPLLFLATQSGASIQASSIELFPTAQSAASIQASSPQPFPATQSANSIQPSSPLLHPTSQSASSIQASSLSLYPTTQSATSIQPSSLLSYPTTQSATPIQTSSPLLHPTTNSANVLFSSFEPLLPSAQQTALLSSLGAVTATAVIDSTPIAQSSVLERSSRSTLPYVTPTAAPSSFLRMRLRVDPSVDVKSPAFLQRIREALLRLYQAAVAAAAAKKQAARRKRSTEENQVEVLGVGRSSGNEVLVDFRLAAVGTDSALATLKFLTASQLDNIITYPVIDISKENAVNNTLTVGEPTDSDLVVVTSGIIVIATRRSTSTSTSSTSSSIHDTSTSSSIHVTSTSSSIHVTSTSSSIRVTSSSDISPSSVGPSVALTPSPAVSSASSVGSSEQSSSVEVTASQTASSPITSESVSLASSLASVPSSSVTESSATTSSGVTSSTSDVTSSGDVDVTVSASSLVIPTSSSLETSDSAITISSQFGSSSTPTPALSSPTPSPTPLPPFVSSTSSTSSSTVVSFSSSLAPTGTISPTPPTTAIIPTSSVQPDLVQEALMKVDLQLGPEVNEQGQEFKTNVEKGMANAYRQALQARRKRDVTFLTRQNPEPKHKREASLYVVTDHMYHHVRRIRATEPEVAAEVTGVARNSSDASIANVAFYVMEDGVPVPAAAASQTLNKLTPNALSAIIAYPVVSQVQPANSQLTPAAPFGDNVSLLFVVAIVMPCILVLLLAFVLMAFLHRSCREPHVPPDPADVVPTKYQRGETLDDYNLHVDVERGEIVDRTPGHTPNPGFRKHSHQLQAGEHSPSTKTPLPSNYDDEQQPGGDTLDSKRQMIDQWLNGEGGGEKKRPLHHSSVESIDRSDVSAAVYSTPLGQRDRDREKKRERKKERERSKDRSSGDRSKERSKDKLRGRSKDRAVEEAPMETYRNEYLQALRLPETELRDSEDVGGGGGGGDSAGRERRESFQMEQRSFDEDTKKAHPPLSGAEDEQPYAKPRSFVGKLRDSMRGRKRSDTPVEDYNTQSTVVSNLGDSAHNLTDRSRDSSAERGVEAERPSGVAPGGPGASSRHPQHTDASNEFTMIVPNSSRERLVGSDLSLDEAADRGGKTRPSSSKAIKTPSKAPRPKSRKTLGGSSASSSGGSRGDSDSQQLVAATRTSAGHQPPPPYRGKEELSYLPTLLSTMTQTSLASRSSLDDDTGDDVTAPPPMQTKSVAVGPMGVNRKTQTPAPKPKPPRRKTGRSGGGQNKALSHPLLQSSSSSQETESEINMEEEQYEEEFPPERIEPFAKMSQMSVNPPERETAIPVKFRRNVFDDGSVIPQEDEEEVPLAVGQMVHKPARHMRAQPRVPFSAMSPEERRQAEMLDTAVSRQQLLLRQQQEVLAYAHLQQVEQTAQQLVNNSLAVGTTSTTPANKQVTPSPSPAQNDRTRLNALLNEACVLAPPGAAQPPMGVGGVVGWMPSQQVMSGRGYLSSPVTALANPMAMAAAPGAPGGMAVMGQDELMQAVRKELKRMQQE